MTESTIDRIALEVFENEGGFIDTRIAEASASNQSHFTVSDSDLPGRAKEVAAILRHADALALLDPKGALAQALARRQLHWEIRS